MRVIWGFLWAALAIVFVAGLFASLAGKRKTPYRTATAFASRELDAGSHFEAARWGAVLAAPENWWPRAELNHRHTDFQSAALPTELLGRPEARQDAVLFEGANYTLR